MGIVSVVYLVFAKEIVGLFTDKTVVIENGALCLQIVAAGYVFYGYAMVVIQSFILSSTLKKEQKRCPLWENFIQYTSAQIFKVFTYYQQIFNKQNHHRPNDQLSLDLLLEKNNFLTQIA